MEYLIAGLIRPLVWVVVVGLLLWLTRKVLPRGWDRYVFAPDYVIGWLIGRAVRAVRNLLGSVGARLRG